MSLLALSLVSSAVPVASAGVVTPMSPRWVFSPESSLGAPELSLVLPTAPGSPVQLSWLPRIPVPAPLGALGSSHIHVYKYKSQIPLVLLQPWLPSQQEE